MVRVPPGRSGRLWLARRLGTGRHAADLLDRKLRILRGEQQRSAEIASRTAAGWREAARRADVWGMRAAVIGGQRELRLAAAGAPARVEIGWRNLMGARYPAEATCTPAEPAAGTRSPGAAALVEAAAAYQEAVRAAAASAAAEATLRVVAAEVAATRRRLRAVNDRWIPRIEAALRERTRELEEAELAEAARLRAATTNLPSHPG